MYWRLQNQGYDLRKEIKARTRTLIKSKSEEIDFKMEKFGSIDQDERLQKLMKCI